MTGTGQGLVTWDLHARGPGASADKSDPHGAFLMLGMLDAQAYYKGEARVWVRTLMFEASLYMF